MTLAHGADLKSTNRYGGTALIPAAERGHVALMRWTPPNGPDVPQWRCCKPLTGGVHGRS
jgi:hypothetical protein